MSDLGGGDAETVIFLDVDGVLNIGVADPGRHPVMFDSANVARAFQILEAAKPLGNACEREVAQRVVAAYQRRLEDGNGDDSTYALLVAEKSTGLSNILVAHFAQILQAAGPRRYVVLASSWRKPSHASKVRALEEAVSKHLGEPFAFDARTPMVQEKGMADRLRLIGKFVAQYCRSSADQHPGAMRRHRVLVLDDFFAGKVCGSVDGRRVSSPADAERYIADLAPAGTPVMLVHTYDEWATPEGLQVRVGSGIRAAHVDAVRAFVGETARERPPQPAYATAPPPPRRRSSLIMDLGRRFASRVYYGSQASPRVA